MSDVALVTGGASGIGRATAELLRSRGWEVVVGDRDLAGSPGLELDVTEPEQVCAAVEAAAAQGRLAGVVNCAGIAPTAPLLELSAAEFRAALEVNLLGTFLVGQAAARRMDGGAIVNIASVSGFRGSPGRAAYGASKGGVLTLTKVMALELAPRGIRVNCVAPGATETPLVRLAHDAETRAGVLAAVPLGRYGHPEETAQAIAFLLDERASSYVTGHTLVVDGGQMIGAGWTRAALRVQA